MRTFAATPSVTPRARPPRGFALVPAVFLVAVLSLLAAFAVRLLSQQQQTVALATLGARALAAANAGVEWASWRALNGACAGGTLDLAEGALAGFTVAVTCAAGTTPEGEAMLGTYVIESVATTGAYGEPGFAQRRVRTVLVEAS